MPCISCNSRDCVHNKDGGCCLEAIKVGSEQAQSSAETICESYAAEGASNCAFCDSDDTNDCACQNSGIECTAEECEYNSSCECTAESINIEKDGTCHTFKK